MNRLARSCKFLALHLAFVVSASAQLPDEIQVYVNDMTRKGDWSLELHLNTTPSGQRIPNFAGAVVTDHGWRVTPEINYGLGNNFDIGLYIPMVKTSDNQFLFGGPKVRFKWLPLQADGASRSFFLGMNLELAHVNRSFSETPWSSELRFIMGWEKDRWLLALNPTLERDLGPGTQNAETLFNTGWKVAYRIRSGVSLGLERYEDLGPWDRWDSSALRSKQTYLILDIDGDTEVNVGVGYGAGPQSDRWTVKMIYSVPLSRWLKL
ncbi:MAG: hypothetical protein ACKN9J_01905 [Holophagaceae bacterium]|jgi:hypothetical protein